LQEREVAREALEKHLDEVHEHRRVGHRAMARIEERKRLARGCAITLRA
jgi:hypothetical protein